jgi:hypothetical protein
MTCQMPRLDELLLSVLDVMTTVTDHLSMHGVVRLGCASKRLRGEVIWSDRKILHAAMMRHFPGMSVDCSRSGRFMSFVLHEYYSPVSVHEYAISFTIRSGISKWRVICHTPKVLALNLVCDLRLFNRHEGRKQIIAVATQWKEIVSRSPDELGIRKDALEILDMVIERAKSSFFLLGDSIGAIDYFSDTFE